MFINEQSLFIKNAAFVASLLTANVAEGSN